MSTIRDKRQSEAVEAYLNSDGKNLICMAPRGGKCRVTIRIWERLRPKTILLLMPRNEIKKSWEDEFKKMSFKGNIEFCTFTSISKIENNIYDFIVIDECHELSSKQSGSVKKLCRNNKKVLCLTGTATKKTKNNLFYNGGITECFNYTINQAVEDKVICDYTIYIHKVALDSKTPQYSGKTEKAKFKAYEWVRDKLMDEEKPYFFLDLKMINLIQNSLAKKNKTKELLEKFRNDRCLVFVGLTSVADDLGIPVYHSKSKEKKIFEDFCQGINYNQLACIKLIQSGITITPINHAILSWFSGNPEDTCQKIARMLGIEYNNPEKKAEIHIICTTEPFEEERLTTALSFFDPKKIKIYE